MESKRRTVRSRRFRLGRQFGFVWQALSKHQTVRSGSFSAGIMWVIGVWMIYFSRDGRGVMIGVVIAVSGSIFFAMGVIGSWIDELRK